METCISLPIHGAGTCHITGTSINTLLLGNVLNIHVNSSTYYEVVTVTIVQYIHSALLRQTKVSLSPHRGRDSTLVSQDGPVNPSEQTQSPRSGVHVPPLEQ